MCNCFEIKLQELDSKVRELNGVVDAHSLWSDHALGFTQSSELGLSVVTRVKMRKSQDRLNFELKEESTLIPLSFCPFCGEKLDDRELLHTQEEDDELIKIFYMLEENLEDRLENLTVKDIDQALTLIHEEMDVLKTSFTTHKDDTKQMIQILHKGNFQDYFIEVFLEFDEEENLYTLSVF